MQTRVSIFHFIGYLEDKSSIASPMLTYMFTIYKDIAHAIRSLET